VKSKSDSLHGDPLEMVTAEKVRRVRRAAEAWLLRRPELRHLRIRFDVIGVRARRLVHVPAAF